MTSTDIYCVYLTTFSGNELPPFYIGYTSIKKILNGYSGSVSSNAHKDTFHTLKRTNPELFKTRILKTFKSKVDAQMYEHYILTKLSAHTNPLYINRHAGGSLYNHDHVTKTFNAEMSMRARASPNYKFTSPEFQQEMSLRAKSKPGWSEKQSLSASETNAKRITLGTHNFTTPDWKSFIKNSINEKSSRTNVTILRELTNGVGLGRNWYRKADTIIDHMIERHSGYAV